MASSFSACLSIALRSVRESMVHDSEDRKKEAFCQYLSNIIYTCGVLKDEAWQRDLKDCYSQETLKLFKLSSQCLERAQDLLRNAGDNLVTSPAPTETQATKETQPLTPSTPLRKTSQDAVDHSSYQFPVASQPNNLKPAQHLHHSSPPISPSFQRRVQYVDEAKRGNTQLLAAYRARMDRREKHLVGNKRTTRKADVATMNLSLFRKMAENIEIAKTRQKSLEKKKSERQQRLREEADRRMGPSSLLTTDEQIKKEMYVKVLEFEQETMWLISFRDQLKARPEDSSLILQIINRILGTNEHPLTKCLQSYQFDIHKQLTAVTEQARDILMHIANLGNVKFSNINQEKNDKTFEKRIELKESDETKEIPFDEELCDLDVDNEGREGPSLATRNSESEEDIKAEVDGTESDNDVFPEEREKEYRRILQTVVSKVQFSLDMLHSLFLLIYEPFSSPVGQDLCLASVECAFIKPLWPLLLNLYRVVNYRKEARLAKVFMKNTSSTPSSLNVPDRLCLPDQNSDGENPVYPYQAVVDELESLSNFACPLEKLECIVRTNRFIVECVEDYYEAKGSSRNSSETVIGCDDLLPILCYVIIRSQLPQLVSECHAMEDFISADYLMGEEGYSLTTFQTALAYLETLGDTKEEHPHEQSSEHEEQSKDIS